MRQTDEADPRGLVREAYAIEGITYEECRAIFLDWALSLPSEMTEVRAARRLLSRHQAEPTDHPMTLVLREALAPAPEPKRRGGSRARRPEV